MELLSHLVTARHGDTLQEVQGDASTTTPSSGDLHRIKFTCLTSEIHSEYLNNVN